MKFTPLFEKNTLRFTALELEKDAPIVSEWTYDPEVVAHLKYDRTQPLTPFEVRKLMEAWKNEAEESGHSFVFGIRPRTEDRILGLLHIAAVQWVHGAGLFNLVIGSSQDWDLYAHEALALTLNYVFDELNLFRVKARVSGDNLAACALFEEFGFYLEIRQRQAIFRAGQWIDQLSYGMLRPEWEVFRSREVA